MNSEYKWAEPKIDVRIPFESGGQLGKEYNRIMGGTGCNWVIFLDHDALILNPHWYTICQEAIKKYPGAGIFTAYTNTCGCRFSRAEDAPQRDAPILHHRKFARQIWNKYGYSCTELDVANIPDRINGFFMMTSKAAWQKVGGFRGTEMFGEDTHYHRKMIQRGIPCYLINGIYVFHFLDRAEGSWIQGAKISKEYWEEFKRKRDERRNRIEMTQNM